MPRDIRNLPDECMTHIIGRGNNIRIFKNTADFNFFKKSVLNFMENANIFIHHYVLMNTHYHLLVWLGTNHKLSDFIKRLHLSYNYYYNKKYLRKGHLWINRFRSYLVEDEAYWLQCARYIELNPVHAMICNHPEKYKWSSYNYYAKKMEDKMVRNTFEHPEKIIKLLSSDEKTHNSYEQYVLDGLNFDYQKLKKKFESNIRIG